MIWPGARTRHFSEGLSPFGSQLTVNELFIFDLYMDAYATSGINRSIRYLAAREQHVR